MMANKGIWIFPVVVLVSVFLAACGDSTAAPTFDSSDSELVTGQEIYSNNCSRCHLNDGAGGSGVQLNEGKVLASYPDAADQRAFIVEGNGRMPGFGGSLSDAEIDAVVRYTREVLAE